MGVKTFEKDKFGGDASDSGSNRTATHVQFRVSMLRSLIHVARARVRRELDVLPLTPSCWKWPLFVALSVPYEIGAGYACILLSAYIHNAILGIPVAFLGWNSALLVAIYLNRRKQDNDKLKPHWYQRGKAGIDYEAILADLAKTKPSPA